MANKIIKLFFAIISSIISMWIIFFLNIFTVGWFVDLNKVIGIPKLLIVSYITSVFITYIGINFYNIYRYK